MAIPKGCPDDALLVADTKYHDGVIRVDNNVALVESRSTRLWVHPKGFWAQALFYRYFRWAGPGPCPDICGYCGHNNGQDGESRNGWDCGMCGGN
jgi:hypothetical protein